MLACTYAINESGSRRAHASDRAGIAWILAVGRLCCLLAVAGSAFAQTPVWNRLSTTGPADRHAQGMAYDSARGRIVLFGGLIGGTPQGDTWEWDGTSWTQRSPEHSPPACHSAGMAYDSARGVTVLFGGVTAGGYSGDTWEWDGEDWEYQTSAGPGPRSEVAMAYDSQRGVTVLFGGKPPTGSLFGDTWEWNGGTWEIKAFSGDGPSNRGYAAMAFDSVRGVTVLFGGHTDRRTVCGDTWEWDGDNWEFKTETGPTARDQAAMVYDATAERDLTVLFGGNTGTHQNDTWVWNGSTWVLEFAGGSPGSNRPAARYGHGMVYAGKVVLFGGFTGVANGDTWDYGVDLPDEWACCFADGSCQDMAEAHCLGAGGASWREGEECSSCECAAPPPQAAYFLGDQPLSGSAAHQVNTATGNFHYSETDLSIASRGGSLAFTRHYNSLDGRSGPLGKGWRHSYHIVLTPPNPPNQTYVAVTWGDGRTTFWEPDPEHEGEFKPATRDLYAKIALSGGVWTVTATNFDEYRFDSSGHLLSIRPKGNSNNEITLDYHAVESDRLIKVTDPVGRWLDLGYDGEDFLTSVADHTSRSVQFNYTGSRLTSVIDVFGDEDHSIDYEYDGNGYLTTVKDQRRDPRITVITNEYAPDGTGRVFHYTDGNGATTDFLFREDETEITRTVDGHEVMWLHKSEKVYERQTIDQDPLGHQIVYTYDDNFNRKTVKDRNGNVTSFTHDSLGNVTSVTAPDDGGTTSMEYNDPNVPHLPTQKTDALGYVTEWTYDERGNMLTEKRYLTIPPGDSFVQQIWAYNSFDQRLTATDERGNTHEWHYTAEGQLDYVIDREGNYTWYGYDSLWRRIWVTDGRGSGPQDDAYRSRVYYDTGDRPIRTESPPVGDPSHLIVQEFGYDEIGNRTSVIDGNNNETTYAYDGNNNLRYVYQPLGRTTESRYDELNRRVKTIDALYHATDYTYDDASRLIEKRDAENNTWRYTHDDHGNVLTASEPSDSDPAGGITVTYEYDAQHRRTSVSNELSHISRTEYDLLGRVTRTIDATEQPTQFTYDGLGRLTAVVDALGGRTEYTYDATGNLLEILDANGHAISVRQYDALNRLTRAEDGNGNYYTYGYDAVGNQTWVRDANAQPDGSVTNLTYDAANRRTAMNYQDGTWVTYVYDDNGNRERMTESADPNTPSLFGYNALNQLTSSVDRYGMRVDYGYDTAGRRTRLVYPGNKELTYVYDAANRLTSITDWAEPARTTQYTYDGLRVATVTYPNTVVQTNGYDTASRLTSLATTLDEATVLSLGWTRDAVGAPLTATETNTLTPTIPTRVVSYEYDSDNRLTESSRGTYEYDDNGNLTSRTIDGATTDFEYDVEDRLTAQIRDPGGAAIRVDHLYDGDGNRIARTDAGGTVRYVLDRGRSMSHVLCETDAGGSVIAYYIHGPTLVARIDAGDTPRYYHTNDLGNVVALTDAAGEVVDRYAYDPYGLPVGHEGDTPNPFTFVGGLGVMTEDPNDPMALYFMRARFYDPDTGRFLGKDPVEGSLTNPLGLNRYAYTLNNPTTLTDSSGQAFGLDLLIRDLWNNDVKDWQYYVGDAIEGGIGIVVGKLNPDAGVAYDNGGGGGQVAEFLRDPAKALDEGARGIRDFFGQVGDYFTRELPEKVGREIDRIQGKSHQQSSVESAVGNTSSVTTASTRGRPGGMSPLAQFRAFQAGVKAKVEKIKADRKAKAAALAAAQARARSSGGGGGSARSGGGGSSGNHARAVFNRIRARIRFMIMRARMMQMMRRFHG